MIKIEGIPSNLVVADLGTNTRNLTGLKFNRLKVLKFQGYVTTTKKHAWWTFLCDCGKVVCKAGYKVSSGATKSCGCLLSDTAKLVHTKHGAILTTTYSTWSHMRTRCLNSNSDVYQYYGGRGIQVCDRWESFENFIQDMGERPEGKSLDRINVNGNYEPSNCRWTSHTEQSYNRNKQSNNTSGRTGVQYNTRDMSWIACIKKNRKYYFLGSFSNFEDAVIAREKGELEYYGYIKE